jgi:hypothetical protein
MTRPPDEFSSSSGSRGATVVQAVTVVMGVVVGLTFMFGFGNVLNLALRLGVPAWVAPLVAPAVDLSILGLLLGSRQLALTGATPAQLRPARQLLIFTSTVTLALNVADPLVAGVRQGRVRRRRTTAADRVGRSRPGPAQGADHRRSTERSNVRRREADRGPVRRRTDRCRAAGAEVVRGRYARRDHPGRLAATTGSRPGGCPGRSLMIG